MGERHLDENQRVVGQGGMKKAVAAPIRLEAASQITPSLNLVHSLVFNHPLQYDRGLVPVDSLQQQGARIEPGAEQVEEVRIDAGPHGMCVQRGDEASAEIDQ